MHQQVLPTILTGIVATAMMAPIGLGEAGAPQRARYASPRRNAWGELSVQGVENERSIDSLQLLWFPTADEVLDAGAMIQMASRGTPCATATSSACQDQVSTLLTEQGIQAHCDKSQNPRGYRLITTQGEKVNVYCTNAEISAFLVPIDTVEEAAWIVKLAGYPVSCHGNQRGGVRETPGGYEVVVTTGSGCGRHADVNRHRLQVMRDGRLRETKVEMLRKGNPNCKE